MTSYHLSFKSTNGIIVFILKYSNRVLCASCVKDNINYTLWYLIIYITIEILDNCKISIIFCLLLA